MPDFDSPSALHMCLFSSAVVRTAWGPTRIGSLARIGDLPACFTGEGESVALLRVEASTSDTLTSAIVDVTIDMQAVSGDDQAPPLPIHLVCTADLMFSTVDGPVRADALAGKVIRRVLADGTADTFTVSEVVPVEFGEPVRVFGLEVDLDTPAVCVGSDATVAAIVFPTL